VDNDRNQRRFESVFSKKVRAGKRRTYFFDVRQTKGDDYYLTITESTKKFNSDGYERHKIFLYKEDFNRFLAGMEETIDFIKTDLMPDYDYDEYTRRHEEWEAQRAADEAAGITRDYSNKDNITEEVSKAPEEATEEKVEATEEKVEATEEKIEEVKESPPVENEDDMSW
jgi:hypothetical protein